MRGEGLGWRGLWDVGNFFSEEEDEHSRRRLGSIDRLIGWEDGWPGDNVGMGCVSGWLACVYFTDVARGNVHWARFPARRLGIQILFSLLCINQLLE